MKIYSGTLNSETFVTVSAGDEIEAREKIERFLESEKFDLILKYWASAGKPVKQLARR